MTSVPERPRPENWATLSPEQRAEWILAPISDAELDALGVPLARLLLSAAKNDYKPRRAAPKAPARLRRQATEGES